MKNSTKNILGGCLLMGLLCVVSCSKYEGPDVNAMTPKSMENTAWVYGIHDSVTVTNDEGEQVKADRTRNQYVIFQNGAFGKCKYEIVSNIAPGVLNYDTVFEFVYSYQMPKGILTHDAIDNFGIDIKMDEQFSVTGQKLMVDWASGGRITYDRM